MPNEKLPRRENRVTGVEKLAPLTQCATNCDDAWNYLTHNLLQLNNKNISMHFVWATMSMALSDR